MQSVPFETPRDKDVYNRNSVEDEGAKFIQQLKTARRNAIVEELLEKKLNFQQLLQYDPWGRPGGGAPADFIKKQNLLQNLEFTNNLEISNGDIDTFFTFGKPGHGAPQKTKSGRLRTQLKGDPAIRFQDIQHVNKSVENGIRYNADKEAQKEYRYELDNLLKEKLYIKRQESELNQKQEMEHEKKNPFGENISKGSTRRRTVSVPDSIFSSTSPRHVPLSGLTEVANLEKTGGNGYDPWGKGVGTPIRDQFGNSIRISPPHKKVQISVADSPGLIECMTKYSGGDGSPHVAINNEVVTKLPRTLEKTGVKDFKVKDELNSSMLASGPSPRTKERQTFLEKLGWTEDVPSFTKSETGKQLYLQYLKRAMEEKRQAKKCERNDSSQQNTELVSLMRERKVGYPRRDLSTGFLLDHKLSTTDVTKRSSAGCFGSSWNTEEYQSILAKQAEERNVALKKQKELEMEETQKHFEAWNTFWYKPGHGAPKNPYNHRKEGINIFYTPLAKSQRVNPGL